MGALDKFISFMKINDEGEEEYYDEDYYDEEELDEEPEKPKKPVSVKEPDIAEDSSYRKTTKVTPMRQNVTRKAPVGSGMEVCVIKPTSVEEAREITETLLSNRTVVLNLEGLDVDIAQRIIDFTSGSCYAIQGNLQKISRYIFIITPCSVDISGDFQDILSGNSLEVPINNGL